MKKKQKELSELQTLEVSVPSEGECAQWPTWSVTECQLRPLLGHLSSLNRVFLCLRAYFVSLIASQACKTSPRLKTRSPVQVRGLMWSMQGCFWVEETWFSLGGLSDWSCGPMWESWPPPPHQGEEHWHKVQRDLSSAGKWAEGQPGSYESRRELLHTGGIQASLSSSQATDPCDDEAWWLLLCETKSHV